MDTLIAYNLLKEDLNYTKLLVRLGGGATIIESGLTIYEIAEKNISSGIAVGVAAAVTGGFTYLLNKKNKESEEKINNLEKEIENKNAS